MAKNVDRSGVVEALRQYHPIDGWIKGGIIKTNHAVPLRARVTGTVATTTFRDIGLAGHGDDAGAGASSIFVGWYVRFEGNPIAATTKTVGEMAVITAYDDNGTFTFGALSATTVVGDEFTILPPWLVGDMWNYTTRSITMAVGTTGSTANPADHEVLTVTGLCRIRGLIVCTTSLTVGAGALISFGDETGADANNIIDQTLATNIDSPMIWHNTSPANVATPYTNAMWDFVSNGLDLGYKLITGTASAGVLEFHFWWQPLAAGGLCVTADGTGAL